VSITKLLLIHWLLTQDHPIALGRAVHGEYLSGDCVFEATTYTQETFGIGGCTYKSALIMYDSPNTNNYWRVMLCGDSSKDSVSASLKVLLDKLREQLGAVMSEFPTTLTEHGLCTLMLTRDTFSRQGKRLVVCT